MEIAIRQGIYSETAMGFLRHLEGLYNYSEILSKKDRAHIRFLLEQVMIPTADCESVRVLDQALVDFLLHFDEPLAQEQTVEVKAVKAKKRKKRKK
jgi:hypothetical protein